MKSGALLPSNLPRVIDRSNLSPSREYIRLQVILIGSDCIKVFHFILDSFLNCRLVAVRKHMI